MFNRKKEQKLIETLSMIKPTSKAELKRQCLYLSNLDVEKAERMYNFLVKDLDCIPAIEPSQTPFLENFGKQASGIMGWFRENQDMLSQGVDMIRDIMGKRGGKAVPTALPKIND